jgi:hypothetical protein
MCYQEYTWNDIDVLPNLDLKIEYNFQIINVIHLIDIYVPFYVIIFYVLSFYSDLLKTSRKTKD